MKRPALQNKRLGVLRMAFRAQKVFGTFEQRAPERDSNPYLGTRSARAVHTFVFFFFIFANS